MPSFYLAPGKILLYENRPLGYIKIQNFKILAPCWEFLIFAKNQEILIFRKSGQKGQFLVNHSQSGEIDEETLWLMYAKN